jgi:hypothetical protein
VNYPTEKEKRLLSTALKLTLHFMHTLTSVNMIDWNVDRTELLNFVMADLDRLNDTVLSLITAQIKED